MMLTKKRGLRAMAIILMLALGLTLAMPFASAACPDGDPLGYLSYKPLTHSTTPFGEGNSVTTVTDHNPETSYTLPKNQYLTIDLGKEVSATALKVQASQPVDVYYYSSGRQLMTVTDVTYLYNGAPDGTIKYTNEEVRNVRYISFSYSGQEDVVNIQELNIYGGAPVPWPDAPSYLWAYGEDNEVYLHWPDVSEAVYYNVKKSTSPEGPFVTVTSSVYTHYSDFNVYNGQTYFYTVTAVDKHNGESPPSRVAWATPEARSMERGILLITMDNGLEREFDLWNWELEAFTNWYENRSEGRGPAAYVIERYENRGPFLDRKEYIVFDKILYFRINRY